MQFYREEPPIYGIPIPVQKGLARVVCHNPGPFTHTGTSSYLIGKDELAIIDPGPDDPCHLQSLLSAIDGRAVRGIFVTHGHDDHASLAGKLSATIDAPVYAYGVAMRQVNHGCSIAPMEEFAQDFKPDYPIENGEHITGSGWTIEAIYTPGHTPDHLCYYWLEQDILFSGDHIMGWSTTAISPPHGHMGDYMNSLRAIMSLKPRMIIPTHGPVLKDPKTHIHGLLAHREYRSQQILEALNYERATPRQLTKLLYPDLPPMVYDAAQLSLLAQLIHLWEKGEVLCDGLPDLDQSFSLANPVLEPI